ncbi:MAG: stage II sporulation protein P [Lachnospiraceae bacterium]
MGRFWKLGYLCLAVMLLLTFSKRYSVSALAMRILIPNYVSTFGTEKQELPITPKQSEVAEEEGLSESEIENIRNQMAEENVLSFQSLLEGVEESRKTEIPDSVLVYSEEQLNDYNFLIDHLYNVDRGTKITAATLNAEKLRSYDFSIDKTTEGPQILIYHTHSQEAFADSMAGNVSDTIVGMGAYLAELLEAQGYSVLHHQGIYDMENGKISREQAYQRAEPEITKIIEENPSLQLVIDLHRDGVGDDVHLVKEIDGKPTAQIMFFNGLSYSAVNGPISYLPNPYIENNLALTLQMKLSSDSLYPGFARKIYLRSLRFNLHLHPQAMLIEAGAQTNTVEEERNAMEVLAKVLGNVLY